MSDRRFSESEIREVFERAAREQQQAARRSSQEGLTLAEMQEVAASAGIDPAFVATAARSVSLGEPETGRLSMGPVARGVFHTEFLPGPPTDVLWGQVVADCRRTFRAQGTVSTVGTSHEWRNGNLIVTLEPAGDGSRLHLRTRRDSVPSQLFLVGMALFAATFLVLTGALSAEFAADQMTTGALLGLIGAVGGAGVWSSQRQWAATRERQMAEIAERAASASVSEAPGSVEVPAASGRIDPAVLDLDGPEAGDTGRARMRTR